MASRVPSLSVVIAAHNAAETLDKCMVALSQQTVAHDEYEIVVVDDGSGDGTAAIAARHGAIVIRQAHAGRASARNAGIAAARGDIVLFTDADCEPAPEWIARMVGPLQDPGIAGVRGAYRSLQTSWTARFVQLEYEDRYDYTARSRYIDFVETYAAAYRREVLLSSGGFDPELPYDEDQELSFRLAEAGCRMVFNPEALVYHRHPENWWSYALRKYWIGFWKAQVLRLHPDKVWHDTHTPWSVKLQVAVAGLALPLAVLALRGGIFPGLLALTGLLFAVSTLPFVHKAWCRDRVIVLATTPMLLVRAWALGMGFIGGWSGLLVTGKSTSASH